jgi:carotenoid biosynthesis protein
MDLLIGTLVLRPYVFAFLVAFLVAGARDLGLRRTLLFAGWVGPVAWLSEFSSTRTGIPFGLYHYTGTTRGRELFIADVPFMDCLSFTFLAYAAFCLARTTLRPRGAPPLRVALVSGVLMMLLDVVIDPAAVRGDRWFLGHIFYYPRGGVYFGVPLTNFAGWMIVGMVGVGGYVCWSGWRDLAPRRGWPGSEGRGSEVSGQSARGGPGSDMPGRSARGGSDPGTANRSARGVGGLTDAGAARGFDRYGRRAWAGIALYYAVLAFNLAVTGWIGEWVLLGVGVALHLATAMILWNFGLRPAARLGLENQRA